MSLDNDITEAPAPAPAPIPALVIAPAPALDPTQAPLTPEIPDYNKIYTGYNPGRDYTYIEPQPLPPAIQSPSTTANRRRSSISTGATFITSSNTTGYGPLDFGYGMTPAIVTHHHPDVPVNMSPFTAPPSGDLEVQGGMVGGNPGRRRSSVVEFFSKVRGDDKNDKNFKASSLPSTTYIHTRRGSSAKNLTPIAPKDNLGRRRSSVFTAMGFKPEAEGTEHKGPYADVSRSQAEYMERMREAERNLHLTHNKDGLPLPQADDIPDVRQRRRSSIAHFFGLDKQLLAR
ncbi:hypothetical protein BG000_011632 [Podila horticola]|nr:hypothetical protein BG000_011632 [Podila horticola]